MTKLVLGTAAVIVAVVLAVILGASLHWTRSGNASIERLRAELSTAAAVRDSSARDSLPLPVRRFFDMVLAPGLPAIRWVHLSQRGEFRTQMSEEGWRDFKADQYATGTVPGFVWDARISMAPLMTVRVRDAYIGGEGSMRGRLISAIPVVDEHSGAELNTAALQRYLAESVWFPTSLLPSERLRWESVDDQTARATLSDRGVTASVEFRFNEAGEIVSVYTPQRFREIRGSYVPTPWEGRFWNYQVRHGFRIPLEGEVAWLLPEGRFAYWRGHITDVEYEFVR